jgi:hypothetical protein
MNEPQQALEQIELITRMIETTRRSGSQYWAALVTFGSLAILAATCSHVLLVAGSSGWIAPVWLAAVAIAFAVNAAQLRRDRQVEQIVSYVDQLLAKLWLAVSLAILTIWIACLSTGAPAVLGVVATASLIGAGLFTSARAVDWAPLQAAGALWWLGALAMAFLPDQMFLIEIGLIVFGYLLPAWRLRQLGAE